MAKQVLMKCYLYKTKTVLSCISACNIRFKELVMMKWQGSERSRRWKQKQDFQLHYVDDLYTKTDSCIVWGMHSTLLVMSSHSCLHTAKRIYLFLLPRSSAEFHNKGVISVFWSASWPPILLPILDWIVTQLWNSEVGLGGQHSSLHWPVSLSH